MQEATPFSGHQDSGRKGMLPSEEGCTWHGAKDHLPRLQPNSVRLPQWLSCLYTGASGGWLFLVRLPLCVLQQTVTLSVPLGRRLHLSQKEAQEAPRALRPCRILLAGISSTVTSRCSHALLLTSVCLCLAPLPSGMSCTLPGWDLHRSPLGVTVFSSLLIVYCLEPVP